MLTWLKKLASRLPESVQRSLKRRYYARRIRQNRFWPGDPDGAHLTDWVGEGDWVIDVGANIGTYAWVLSNLVGASGRVICFEPVGATFATLAANVRCFKHANVTLVNAAVSREVGLVGMMLPERHGHEAAYFARVVPARSSQSVLALKLDGLELGDVPIKLVKIDVEGHELAVIEGMIGLIERHRPYLIIEGTDARIEELLTPLGYRGSCRPGSPNTIFSTEGRAGTRDRLVPDGAPGV
jgi:FkbM family methyltransferase